MNDGSWLCKFTIHFKAIYGKLVLKNTVSGFCKMTLLQLQEIENKASS